MLSNYYPFLLSLLVGTLPASLAADYLIIPANDEAAKALETLHLKKEVLIEGHPFVIEDIDALTAKTTKIFEKYVVPRLDAKNTPLSEILRFLQQGVIDVQDQARENNSSKFFLSIASSPEISQQRIDADFSESTLKTILENLAAKTGARVKICGSRIILVPLKSGGG